MIKAIKQSKNEYKLVIPKASMARFVEEVVKDVIWLNRGQIEQSEHAVTRIQASAFGVLHEMAELLLIRLFESMWIRWLR
jgi:histone H3/H4